MLSFPTALPPQDFYKGKQNQNSSAAFSEKPLEWEKKDEGVWGFLTHQNLLNLFFFAIALFVSQSFRLSPTAREQTPSQIIPEERVLLSPKGHPERGMTC